MPEPFSKWSGFSPQKMTLGNHPRVLANQNTGSGPFFGSASETTSIFRGRDNSWELGLGRKLIMTVLSVYFRNLSPKLSWGSLFGLRENSSLLPNSILIALSYRMASHELVPWRKHSRPMSKNQSENNLNRSIWLRCIASTNTLFGSYLIIEPKKAKTTSQQRETPHHLLASHFPQ